MIDRSRDLGALPGFVLGAVLFALVLPACSSEDASPERTNAPSSSEEESSGDDADGVSATPDPEGGRDDSTASCFAACQNGLFSCQAQSGATITVSSADVTPDIQGCSGTMTEGDVVVALELNCAQSTVCLGSAPGEAATICVPGTFSAFSFAYTPNGSAKNLCTRN